MAEGNVGLAFGLVIAAGLCTALGACIAFFTKVTNTKVLAGALGVSAGVMLYVSFVEIFSTKSIQGFKDSGMTDSEAYRYATFTLFGGMLFTWFLDQVCHAILHLSDHCSSKQRAARNIPQASNSNASTPSVAVTVSDAADADPAPAAAAAAAVANKADLEPPVANDMEAGSTTGSVGNCVCDPDHHPVLEIPPGEQEAIVAVLKADHHTNLARMGLLSGLAVGIHNFPEGLATFVGTLADPSAGVAIAVAIALHNIPEGMVVAMPIYYATGSKWKGFLWSVVSGLSEPIGGLLGWLILRGSDADPMMYAIMFAIVAGMMIYISIHELLPTALLYDPENKVTTRGATVGMVVMAASLLLFQI